MYFGAMHDFYIPLRFAHSTTTVGGERGCGDVTTAYVMSLLKPDDSFFWMWWRYNDVDLGNVGQQARGILGNFVRRSVATAQTGSPTTP